MLFYDIIIISFSSSSENLKTLNKKEQNCKHLNSLINDKSILGEIKSISHKLLRAFLGKTQKITGTSFMDLNFEMTSKLTFYNCTNKAGSVILKHWMI